MGWFLAPEVLLTTTELFGAAELTGISAAGLMAPASVAEAALVTGGGVAGAGGLFGSGVGVGDIFTGIGAVSALAGGRQGQIGADFEAAQFREEQENARVAAIQDEAQRRRQLMRTLSSINALRAGRGVEMFEGGTGEAIRKQVVL